MMKELIPIIGVFLVIALIIFAGIEWDIYRWHAFQQVTHSNIGFWKWQFVFNNKH